MRSARPSIDSFLSERPTRFAPPRRPRRAWRALSGSVLARRRWRATFAVFLNAGTIRTRFRGGARRTGPDRAARRSAYRFSRHERRYADQPRRGDADVDADCPACFDLLSLRRRRSRRPRAGAFDITAGPLVKVWGFYKRARRHPQRSRTCRRRSTALAAGTWCWMDHVARSISARPAWN